MASQDTDLERRSKIAEACIDFGSHLFTVRVSSVTPDDIQSCVKDLFEWFEEHEAFTPGNSGIAIHAVGFGEQFLESRKTATVDDAVEAIRNLYKSLAN